MLSLSVASSTLEANKILPPLVRRVASEVLLMFVLARILMPAPDAVDSILLFKFNCPPSTLMGPLMAIALFRVMLAVLEVLPKVNPVSVLA